MNITRKILATTSALVLSLGFALPAAALDAYGTVNSTTQGTVNVSGAKANANVGVDVNVGAGAGASSTTSGVDNAQGSGDANATMQANANTNVEIAPLVITRSDVDGGTVTASASTPSAVKTRADLSGYVAAEMKSDANISSVEAASDSVSVSYKQPAKLFGFIPVTVDATASVDANGNVTVSYPWYAFLMATNKSDLQAKVQDSVSANAAVNGNSSTEATVQLTADAQARMVAAVKSAMQAELNASANASANGSANIQ